MIGPPLIKLNHVPAESHSFKSQQPDFVVIDPQQLTDHDPFRGVYPSIASALSSAMADRARTLEEDEYQQISSGDISENASRLVREYLGMEVLSPSEYLKSWIVDAGAEVSRIVVQSTDDREKNEQQCAKATTPYYIHDRHVPCPISVAQGALKDIKLPLMSVVESAYMGGLMELDPSTEAVGLASLLTEIVEEIDVKS